jgi:hypothetical protein
VSAEPAATFVVDYPCERRCRVEYDTTDVNARTTHGQLQLRTEAAHKAAHKADPPVKVYTWHGDILVKAGAL